MARTHLTLNQVSYPWNHANATAIKAHVDEIDHALDVLAPDSVTDNSTIHHVDGMTTANVTLATFTVNNDGVTHTAGKRILVRAQTNAEDNGIYVVGTVGGGTAALTRAADWNVAAEIKCNMIVAVSGGTVGANTVWQITGDFPLTLGTSHQHFVQRFNATELASTAASKGASLIGIQDSGNLITATNVETALAELAPRTVKRATVNIKDEDLSGASQTVAIGTTLTTGAFILGYELAVIEQFAGLADVTIKIGATDDDAIVASTDLDALAPGYYQGTAGARPQGNYGGEQLNAIIASAGGDLTSLTNGELRIDVMYAIMT